MTRQEAAEVLTALKQSLEMSDDYDYCYYSRDIDAYDTALTALREIDDMYATETIGESMAKTLKQACPYCSWIDPERLEEDEVDGPQNYCRVCGRDLRR